MLAKVKDCTQKKISTGKIQVKALGVWLSTDPETTIKLNFVEKIEKMRNCLGCWSVRRLSLIGKITVLKTLVAFQVIHLLSHLQTNTQIIKQLNDLFFDFLWNSKGDKIKRNVISAVARPNGQPRQEGVARGVRGHAPPPREILNFSLSEMRFAAFSGPFGNFFSS